MRLFFLPDTIAVYINFCRDSYSVQLKRFFQLANPVLI